MMHPDALATAEGIVLLQNRLISYFIYLLSTTSPVR